MLQLLCRAPYSGAILKNAVAIKSIRIYFRKSCSALAPKVLVKFDSERLLPLPVSILSLCCASNRKIKIIKVLFCI